MLKENLGEDAAELTKNLLLAPIENNPAAFSGFTKPDMGIISRYIQIAAAEAQRRTELVLATNPVLALERELYILSQEGPENRRGHIRTSGRELHTRLQRMRAELHREGHIGDNHIEDRLVSSRGLTPDLSSDLFMLTWYQGDTFDFKGPIGLFEELLSGDVPDETLDQLGELTRESYSQSPLFVDLRVDNSVIHLSRQLPTRVEGINARLLVNQGFPLVQFFPDQVESLADLMRLPRLPSSRFQAK